MVSVLEHEMVPKHEVLTATEKNEVLETIGIVKEQLPVIKETDSVSKELAAKPGDVLRIVRKSQTAGHTVYYRLVTAD